MGSAGQHLYPTAPGLRPESSMEARLADLAGELLAFMQHHAGERHLGADLAQDALAQAFASLRTVRDPGALRAWLFRIAVNRFNDHVRQGRLRPRRLEEEADLSAPSYVSPEREALARELDGVLRQELLRLPERQRSVLLLHSVKDLTHRQIGELLGIRPEAVKTALFHAREKIRLRLERYLERLPVKRRRGTTEEEDPA